LRSNFVGIASLMFAWFVMIFNLMAYYFGNAMAFTLISVYMGSQSEVEDRQLRGPAPGCETSAPKLWGLGLGPKFWTGKTRARPRIFGSTTSGTALEAWDSSPFKEFLKNKSIHIGRTCLTVPVAPKISPGCLTLVFSWSLCSTTRTRIRFLIRGFFEGRLGMCTVGAPK
jgi:hypothetical protein